MRSILMYSFLRKQTSKLDEKQDFVSHLWDEKSNAIVVCFYCNWNSAYKTRPIQISIWNIYIYIFKFFKILANNFVYFLLNLNHHISVTNFHEFTFSATSSFQCYKLEKCFYYQIFNFTKQNNRPEKWLENCNYLLWSLWHQPKKGTKIKGDSQNQQKVSLRK